MPVLFGKLEVIRRRFRTYIRGRCAAGDIGRRFLLFIIRLLFAMATGGFRRADMMISRFSFDFITIFALRY